MKKIIYISTILVLCFYKSFAADYNASLFGCISDGQTNNTGSIQYAVNYIAKKGGGTLHFYVGRYLTGGIELKSNVTIELHEGAILVGTASIYDYIGSLKHRSLLYAKDQSNIKIIGKGVIQGQGKLLGDSQKKQAAHGFIDLAKPTYAPSLIGFDNCTDIVIDGIMLQDAIGPIQAYKDCKNLQLANQTIINKGNRDSIGLLLENCKAVKLSHLFIDVDGKAISKDNSSQVLSMEKCITPDGNSI